MTTALIGSSLSRPGSIQPASVRPSVITQPFGDFIPIDRTDEYWVSIASFMRAYAAGTGRVVVHEYSAAKTWLARTEIAAIAAAEERWTRHSGHFGPEATVTCTAWNAATAWVKLDAYADGYPDMTWELDAWQVERGPHPTAYAPRPQELINSQIDREDIAELAIVGPKIAELAITETKIAPDSISTPLLQANAVAANKIAARAVETEKLAAGAVTAEKVAANAIETNHLAAGSVNADKIQAGAVESDKIAAGAIVTGKIAANVAATGMLIVSAADGTTVIIDGTSRMYRILASGSIDATLPASDPHHQEIVTLSGLGTWDTIPAHLSFIGTSLSPGETRALGTAYTYVTSPLHAAVSSGGSPTDPFLAIGSLCQIATFLNGSDQVVVGIGGNNMRTSSFHYYGRYNVLDEAAL
jgi:hypothetical protein